MKINLYIDNDSRPRGSYENCRSATMTENRLTFTSITGKRFMTNLRYLIEVEDGDVEYFEDDKTFAINGRPKPKPQPKDGAKQKAMGFAPERDEDF